VNGDRAIRWGMIGVGSVAEHKSGPAFMCAEGGRLAGVASRREDAARAYADRHGVPRVFATPEALVHCPDIDAVYIATRPASHASLALEVAKAGKPCCVEKPMAVRHEDARRMCEGFDAAGVPLFVSYYRRSLPRFLFVADAIRRGEIGELHSVDWILRRMSPPPNAAPPWRLDVHQAPGGLFEDLACHGLDLFDSLLGAITNVGDARMRLRNDQVVPDLIEATWQHGACAEGHGLWDFDAARREDAVTLRGTSGMIRFSMFDEAPIEIESSGQRRREAIPNPVPIQLPHVVALNACLHGLAPHPSTGASALRTAWVTSRILRLAGVHGPKSDPER